MEANEIIKVRFPEQRSYRRVKLIAPVEGYEGWWQAWTSTYAQRWSLQKMVHESWRRGRGPRVERIR